MKEQQKLESEGPPALSRCSIMSGLHGSSSNVDVYSNICRLNSITIPQLIPQLIHQGVHLLHKGHDLPVERTVEDWVGVAVHWQEHYCSKLIQQIWCVDIFFQPVYSHQDDYCDPTEELRADHQDHFDAELCVVVVHLVKQLPAVPF